MIHIHKSVDIYPIGVNYSSLELLKRCLPLDNFKVVSGKSAVVCKLADLPKGTLCKVFYRNQTKVYWHTIK